MKFKEKLKQGKDLNEYKFYKYLLSICDKNMNMRGDYFVEIEISGVKNENKRR